MTRKAVAWILLLLVLCMGTAQAEDFDGKWLNSNILGNVTQDTPNRVYNDFYLNTLRDWILETDIPEGWTNISSFSGVEIESRKKKLQLIREASTEEPDALLVRRLADLYTDWEQREEVGYMPLQPVMKAIDEAQTLQNFSEFLASDLNLGSLCLMNMEVGINHRDAGTYLVNLLPPSLILKDSAEYAQQSALGTMLHDLNRGKVLYMLGRMGVEEADAEAVFDGALAFEGLLAGKMMSLTEVNSDEYPRRSTNILKREELEGLTGEYPLERLMDLRGMGHSLAYNLSEPEYARQLGKVYTQENLPLLRDWAKVWTLLSFSDSLDRESLDQLAAIENRVRGVQGTLSEDQELSEYVGNWLTVPLDNLYIARYGDAGTRQEICRMISEIVDTYEQMLMGETWLHEQTRRNAIEKLENIQINVMYPDELGDWSDLKIGTREEGENLISAKARILAYLAGLNRERINQKVDRTWWNQKTMPTSLTNAFYDPELNSINIMASILNEPFYSPEMTYEQKLGAIGTVIGHEISHAFDVVGCQYDKDGALRNWWVPEDFEAFMKRSQKLIDFYDRLTPVPEMAYSGEMVCTEAIADMGGVKAILSLAMTRPGFNYDQMFRSYARIFRCKAVRSYIYMLVKDPHPMYYLRANVTLQQFQKFIDLYDIQPWDDMYLAPQDRILVW